MRNYPTFDKSSTVYELELPNDMTAEDRAEWRKLSWNITIRMGPRPVKASETGSTEPNR